MFFPLSLLVRRHYTYIYWYIYLLCLFSSVIYVHLSEFHMFSRHHIVNLNAQHLPAGCWLVFKCDQVSFWDVMLQTPAQFGVIKKCILDAHQKGMKRLDDHMQVVRNLCEAIESLFRYGLTDKNRSRDYYSWIEELLNKLKREKSFIHPDFSEAVKSVSTRMVSFYTLCDLDGSLTCPFFYYMPHAWVQSKGREKKPATVTLRLQMV